MHHGSTSGCPSTSCQIDSKRMASIHMVMDGHLFPLPYARAPTCTRAGRYACEFFWPPFAKIADTAQLDELGTLVGQGSKTRIYRAG
jgi:hypothetical protein